MSLLDSPDPIFGINIHRTMFSAKPWIWTALEVKQSIQKAIDKAFQ